MESENVVLLTAMELSRQYREKMLRQEFGSWLLEDHIEQAVIATDPVGTVVFWNRFASELYQYSPSEAMGQNIMGLTPSEMTQEQGMQIFGKLQKGEHWKGFFGVQRKDKTPSPIMHEGLTSLGILSPDIVVLPLYHARLPTKARKKSATNTIQLNPTFI